MTMVSDIEDAVSRLSTEDLVSFRSWFDRHVESRLGTGRPFAAHRLPDGDRARLMAQARKVSRRLRRDPSERALLDHIEELQVENTDIPL